jgi:hypothetical protein
MAAFPFPDRIAFLFGYRFDAHEATVVPPATPGTAVSDPVIPTAGIPGPPPDPFNPADGPTTMCMLWATGFVDNVREPFPFDLDDPIWLGIQKFLNGSFAYAELFTADGTLVTSGYLDAAGCLPAQELGVGHYYLRVFTEFRNNGMEFRVERDEEPIATRTPKVLSLTLSIFLRNPGTPGLGAANVYWENATNAAATASLALQKDASGVDLGLARNNTNPVQYSFRINVMSNFSDIVGAYFATPHVHLYPSFEGWTHTARWKFVIGHEFGHMLQAFAGASLSAVYFFDPGTNTSNASQAGTAPDPVSAAPLADCNCSTVNHPLYASHCLQSMEISESAQSEAFGHFTGARIWNRTPTEANYDGSCSFSYYKNVVAANLRGGDDGIPVVPIDCANAYAHRDQVCSAVVIDGHVVGSEVDWLTFLWAITTDGTAPAPVNVSTVLGWYRAALGRLPGSGNMTYALLRAEAVLENPAFGPWLDDRAQAHAVD